MPANQNREKNSEEDGRFRRGHRYPGCGPLSRQPNPAQQTGADTPPPKHPETRIAAINLASVVKNYQKAAAFEAEFKGELQKYEAGMAQIKGELTTKDAQLKDPKTPAQTKEQLDADMTALTRKIQDMEKNGASG